MASIKGNGRKKLAIHTEIYMIVILRDCYLIFTFNYTCKMIHT